MDPGTVAGIAIGTAGILISLSIAFWQRRPKRLAYDLTTNRGIVTRTSYQESGDFRIMYGARELQNPYLIVVRVVNDGKIEIRPEDWQEEFSVEVGPEIIDSAVVATSSNGLDASVTVRESHKIRCNKLLLNKGEWFDVQMLVDGPLASTLSVSARVAGTRLVAARRGKIPRFSWPIFKWLGDAGLTGVIVAATGTIGVVTALTLTLVWIPSSQPESTVPTLTKQPVTRVIAELHNAKLHLGNEQFIPSTYKPGTVVDQYPSAGSQADTGSQVSIVVAQHS